MGGAAHLDFGRDLEERALKLLLLDPSRRLLAKNYRSKQGEIDLILEEQRATAIELVFVEVRARHERGLVGALESVGPKKRLKIQRTAHCFMTQYRGAAQSVRFDLIAFENDTWIHLQNAWTS